MVLRARRRVDAGRPLAAAAAVGGCRAPLQANIPVTLGSVSSASSTSARTCGVVPRGRGVRDDTAPSARRSSRAPGPLCSGKLLPVRDEAKRSPDVKQEKQPSSKKGSTCFHAHGSAAGPVAAAARLGRSPAQVEHLPRPPGVCVPLLRALRTLLGAHGVQAGHSRVRSRGWPRQRSGCSAHGPLLALLPGCFWALGARFPAAAALLLVVVAWTTRQRASLGWLNSTSLCVKQCRARSAGSTRCGEASGDGAVTGRWRPPACAWCGGRACVYHHACARVCHVHSAHHRVR